MINNKGRTSKLQTQAGSRVSTNAPKPVTTSTNQPKSRPAAKTKQDKIRPNGSTSGPPAPTNLLSLPADVLMGILHQAGLPSRQICKSTLQTYGPLGCRLYPTGVQSTLELSRFLEDPRRCNGISALDLSSPSASLHIQDSTLFVLARKCRRLQRLSLKGCDAVSASGLQQLNRLAATLLHLDISRCPTRSFPALKTLAKLTKLTSLTLSHSHLPYSGTHLRFLQQLPHLAQLHILPNPNDSPAHSLPDDALPVLASLPTLHHLTLPGVDSVADTTFEHLTLLSSLSSLHISHCSHRPQPPHLPLLAIGELTTLTQLRLGNEALSHTSPLTHRQVGHLDAACVAHLATLPALQHLHLQPPDDHTALQHILAISTLTHLSLDLARLAARPVLLPPAITTNLLSLSLQNGHVGPHTLRHLTTQVPHLQHLALWRCEVHAHLSALSTLSALTSLHITAAAGGTTTGALTDCSQLRRLVLDGCDVKVLLLPSMGKLTELTHLSVNSGGSSLLPPDLAGLRLLQSLKEVSLTACSQTMGDGLRWLQRSLPHGLELCVLGPVDEMLTMEAVRQLQQRRPDVRLRVVEWACRAREAAACG